VQPHLLFIIHLSILSNIKRVDNTVERDQMTGYTQIIQFPLSEIIAVKWPRKEFGYWGRHSRRQRI